ncbi:MAG: hypothetical protein HQK50_04920 [Oligoflexia bacterium]|nr:hypothetical protein [Oligoflexia bacterium]MBF0364889.1 hypothetical protein [Oligoflexia bacterium]
MRLLLLFLILVYTNTLDASIYKKGLGTRVLGHYLGTTLDLDFSKSFMSVYVDFQKRPTPVLHSIEQISINDEFLFYLKQFKNSFYPKYFLVEFDYFPLTNFGLYMYEDHRARYSEMEVKFRSSRIKMMKETEINAIRLITTRYEMPYTFSFFLGEILAFVTSETSEEDRPITTQTGSAIMGHVLTIGNERLIQMEKRKDYWLQYMYKIKGTDDNPHAQKRWVFQLGYIHHKNEQFIDAFLFNIARDWAMLFNQSWLANLKIDYFFSVPAHSAKNARGLQKYSNFQKLVFGRNFNLGSVVLGLEGGIKWETFMNNLNDDIFSETSVILSPNISW